MKFLLLVSFLALVSYVHMNWDILSNKNDNKEKSHLIKYFHKKMCYCVKKTPSTCEQLKCCEVYKYVPFKFVVKLCRFKNCRFIAEGEDEHDDEYIGDDNDHKDKDHGYKDHENKDHENKDHENKDHEYYKPNNDKDGYYKPNNDKDGYYKDHGYKPWSDLGGSWGDLSNKWKEKIDEKKDFVEEKFDKLEDWKDKLKDKLHGY